MRRAGMATIVGVLVGLGLTGCDLFGPPTVTVAYRADFESSADAVWSIQRTGTTPVGARTFLGPFDNEALDLKLPDLPAHTRVDVSFDLYVMGSWEGNASVDSRGRAVGPDVWRLSVTGGRQLEQTSFSNVGFVDDYDHQAYPDRYPTGDHPARTGAFENNTLGYLQDFPGIGTRPVDAIYHLEYAFDHDDALLWLVFSGSGLSGHEGESWGLDNVRIRLH